MYLSKNLMYTVALITHSVAVLIQIRSKEIHFGHRFLVQLLIGCL